MFSLVSAVKISMTTCESSISDEQIAPISFANPTLSAWKLLSTYLVISATLIGTWKRGPGKAFVDAQHERSATRIRRSDNSLGAHGSRAHWYPRAGTPG